MTEKPRASLREEQRKLTRNRLLDAAVGVLSEKSIIDTTMEDIARAAGVTRVTVYAHFPGKAEIVDALAERVYGVLGTAFADLAALPRWNRTTVRAWLDTAANRWSDVAPILRVVRPLSSAVNRNSTDARDQFVSAQQSYTVALLENQARWRQVAPAEAAQRARMAVLQTEAFLSAWLIAGVPMDEDDPLILLTDSLCHLLGPACERDESDPDSRKGKDGYS
ncbi:TetR/AcrR family transcriptional regulator [Actinoplanes sp. RD1]|uniref:TetR/AcrR family transcriptional regulator n=1 Tax=Actinoplanes sp. RD1 TaxID=3064538 RepID=UPI0027414435|nr:TetR/AcrR family transcriptional regulator [Actinoplanes sp. RD1]